MNISLLYTIANFEIHINLELLGVKTFNVKAPYLWPALGQLLSGQ